MRFLQVLGVTLALIAVIAAATAAAPPAPHRVSSAYFKAGVLQANEDADADLDLWYSGALAQMRDTHGKTQPAIWQQGNQPVEESYREIVGRGREYVMAIRVYKSPDGKKSYQLDELDFRANGNAPRTHRGALSDAQWDRFTHAVDQTHFLNSPPTSLREVKDCPNYILEGRRGEREYSLVSVGCRDDATARRYQSLIADFDDIAGQVGWFPY